jgi:flagella synthesis protein FlgN
MSLLSRALAPARAAAGDAGQLTALLQAERDGFAALAGLLQTEQEVLVRGDAETLVALASEKSQRLQGLQVLGEQRDRQLAQARGGSFQVGDITRWLDSEPALAATAARLWRELLGLAEMARQLNRANGKLIESALQRNRQKLNVLRGAALPDAVVYSTDGLLHAARGARALLVA